MWSLRTQSKDKQTQAKTVMHHDYIQLLLQIQGSPILHTDILMLDYQIFFEDICTYVLTLLNKLLIWVKISLFKKYLHDK